MIKSDELFCSSVFFLQDLALQQSDHSLRVWLLAVRPGEGGWLPEHTSPFLFHFSLTVSLSFSVPVLVISVLFSCDYLVLLVPLLSERSQQFISSLETPSIFWHHLLLFYVLWVFAHCLTYLTFWHIFCVFSL